MRRSSIKSEQNKKSLENKKLPETKYVNMQENMINKLKKFVFMYSLLTHSYSLNEARKIVFFNWWAKNNPLKQRYDGSDGRAADSYLMDLGSNTAILA